MAVEIKSLFINGQDFCFAQLGVDLNHETMIENLGYWDGDQNSITTFQWSRFFQNNNNIF